MTFGPESAGYLSLQETAQRSLLARTIWGRSSAVTFQWLRSSQSTRLPHIVEHTGPELRGYLWNNPAKH